MDAGLPITWVRHVHTAATICARGRGFMVHGFSAIAVERNALRKAARGYGSAARTLGEIFKRLEKELAAIHCPEGNDEYGQAFRSNHDPLKQMISELAGGIGDGLEHVRDGLIATVDNYELAEQRSTTKA